MVDIIDLPVPMIVLGLGMISVFFHALSLGVGTLVGDDARERAIQSEIQRERERSGLTSPLPKRKVDDGVTVIEATPTGAPAVRLTEDGEFTDTFIEELEGKDNQKPQT